MDESTSTDAATTPKPPSVLKASIVGLGTAAAAAAIGYAAGGWTLVVAAAIAFGVNWAAFVPAYALKTERFYDLTGSLTYLTLMVWSVVPTSQLGLRQALVTGAVCVWALRLGTFLFNRIRKDGKDGRFDAIKRSAPRFFIAWSLQGLWVFLTLLAVLIINTDRSPETLGIADVVGLAVWAVGFAIEVVADRQKSAFRARAGTQGQWIDEGLWSLSRHPNYLGEILLWTGLFIVGAGQFSGWQWLGVVSPVFVALLLTRGSGIPLLEARADKRWGTDPAYVAYKARVPQLVPRLRPPRL